MKEWNTHHNTLNKEGVIYETYFRRMIDSYLCLDSTNLNHSNFIRILQRQY